MEFHGEIEGGKAGIEEAHVASLFQQRRRNGHCCEMKGDFGEGRKFERVLERNVIVNTRMTRWSS